MFERFTNKYYDNNIKSNSILQEEINNIFNNIKGTLEFFEQFSGMTFGEGLYRVHKIDEIANWNLIVSSAFPKLSPHILCFAYDWLGRHFALDFRRKEKGQPMVILLEPGTGNALEIPATFISFHEEELIDYSDSALAVEFFNQWKRYNAVNLLPGQCIGYKVPLFLGGKDLVENLEISDMEVYWEICAQLLNKLRGISPNVKITGASVN